MFDSKARGDAGHRMVERCDPRGEGYGRALYASRAVIKICFFRFSRMLDRFWYLVEIFGNPGKSTQIALASDFDAP